MGFTLKLLIMAVFLCTAIVVLYLLDRRRDKVCDRMSFRETLDLTGLPIVTFKQGGRRLNFILDTGAQNSLIDKRALKGIEYTELEGNVTGYGVDGTIHNLELVGITMSYKDKEYSDVFRALDMAASFGNLKRDYGVTVHGLLSSSFFEKYKYVLNYNDLVAYSMS